MFFSHMNEVQYRCWNEGLDFHPNDLGDCPYEVGTDEYNHFEDGWWYADND